MTTPPTIAAVDAVLATVERSVHEDADARRATLTAIIERLEAQCALADQMAGAAKEWLDKAACTFYRAVSGKETAASRRALEDLEAAQEAHSDAAGVAYRLAVRMGRYQTALRDLEGW